MNRDEFWTIIDSTLEAKDQDEQLGLIKTELKKLSDAEIVSFDNIFRELHGELYKWSLWMAASIITGYWSDDGFIDFRYWVISKGRIVFENALKNPDSLAEVITQSDIDNYAAFEEFGYIASRVYEERTGRDIWDVNELSLEVGESDAHGDAKEILNDDDFDFDSALGEKWDFSDRKEMRRRYPKLLRMFPDSQRIKRYFGNK